MVYVRDCGTWCYTMKSDSVLAKHRNDKTIISRAFDSLRENPVFSAQLSSLTRRVKLETLAEKNRMLLQATHLRNPDFM